MASYVVVGMDADCRQATVRTFLDDGTAYDKVFEVPRVTAIEDALNDQLFALRVPILEHVVELVSRDPADVKADADLVEVKDAVPPEKVVVVEASDVELLVAVVETG